MSLQSLLTVVLLIPDRPIACPRSSTRRVDTPPTQALLDDGDEGLLGCLARLEEGREVAALPEFRDAELEAAEPGVEGSVAVAVAIGRALAGSLVSPGADHSLHIGLHQELHDGLGNAAQEVAISGFDQQLGQGWSVLGHRILMDSGEASQLHRSRSIRWPPQT